jgi:hypothetical protein
VSGKSRPTRLTPRYAAKGDAMAASDTDVEPHGFGKSNFYKLLSRYSLRLLTCFSYNSKVFRSDELFGNCTFFVASQTLSAVQRSLIIQVP